MTAQSPRKPAVAKEIAKEKAASGPKDPDREIKLGEDEPGCKDSALVPRIPGCSIIQCDSKDMETIELQIGVSTDGAVQKEAMEGATEVIYYLCPVKTSLGHIVKLSESALVKAGFKTIYSGKDGDDQPIVTAMKDTQWLQVSTYMYNDNGAYILTSMKVAPEDQANAEALTEEMNRNGRVVLSGIDFQNEADLAAESEKTLQEIAAFLVRQPEWKIRVEGHTDTNGGDKASNMVLSQKRASAVAQWLLEHGIDKSRLSILGHGDTKPIAENDTNEGRAKNRRIELVRFQTQ